MTYVSKNEDMDVTELSTEAKYRAIFSRTARFDGWFFFGVITTGIYCRPSCPAPRPKQHNVQFFPTAAAAHHAGFRACLRCRPDSTPGSPEWNIRTDVTARAMRLINAGVIDEGGVPLLAGKLGYSERQLNRILTEELGAGPLMLARAQRAQTARLLLETTALSFSDVAFGAGFASIRQFNDTIREIFVVTPSELRKNAIDRSKEEPAKPQTGNVTVRLAYRAPLAAEQLFEFLFGRAIPGVEEQSAGNYSRALRLPHGPGVVILSPQETHINATFYLTNLQDLTAAIYASRRLLDLDADPTAIDEVLGADPILASAVKALPGLRVPGTVDPNELAIRAIIGQQISVAAARTVAARLAQQYGTALATPMGGISRTFPTPAELLAADPSTWPMPQARKRTLQELCKALVTGQLVLDPGADRQEARKVLLGLPGIGPWTASYILLRGLGSPDEFLDTDLGVQRGAASLGIRHNELLDIAENWRPYRSYSVLHLWSTSSRRKEP